MNSVEFFQYLRCQSAWARTEDPDICIVLQIDRKYKVKDEAAKMCDRQK
jgi:hypothetical protein